MWKYYKWKFLFSVARIHCTTFISHLIALFAPFVHSPKPSTNNKMHCYVKVKYVIFIQKWRILIIFFFPFRFGVCSFRLLIVQIVHCVWDDCVYWLKRSRCFVVVVCLQEQRFTLKRDLCAFIALSLELVCVCVVRFHTFHMICTMTSETAAKYSSNREKMGRIHDFCHVDYILSSFVTYRSYKVQPSS